MKYLKSFAGFGKVLKRVSSGLTQGFKFQVVEGCVYGS